ncbi:aspartate/glutamate racemase family protein [Zophobihabitans entericus]|uniref:Aspartate/glutamate racemase family protein n=1 Tax=Zophobihabitans entericus TaxID=1635327 RepID=A0A6G9IDA4_9GAMM|nr:aspartate/glutamate racemase family protein [Zophobihabitans entericus]QIQ21802.1 aspartate/glutamate racemase family protein [Zophobihabitans entericus]
MQTIGLLGGMSWESTVTYYQVINRIIKKQLGGLHSAKCVLYSVDFQEIESCQANGDWEQSAKILTKAAQNLEKAGADFIVICTNTMHKVASQIQAGIAIPIHHIAEMTAKQLQHKKIKRVALLGTKYTMEQDFYKNVLIKNGIEVLIPDEEERTCVNDIIYHELCLGVIKSESKQQYLRIIDHLVKQGAEGIILGCTEIGLLINQTDTNAPLFDTSLIHATSAALRAIGLNE